MRMRMRTAAGVLAGAVVGLTASLALAGPAHATDAASQVDTVSTCEAYEVTIDPGSTQRTWRVDAQVDGEDWLWPDGDLAPAGDAPGNGWIAGEPHTVAVPAGATEVSVAWWHAQSDPDLDGDGWETSLADGAWSHPGGEACGLPSVEVLDADCDTVEIEYSNPTAEFFSGDYRVDGADGEADEWSADEVGEGPHAGERFGDRYHQQVDLPAGATTVVELDFEPGSGEHTIEYVIRRGAEQHWYVPWGEVAVDCGRPDPTPSPTPTSSPGGTAGGGDEELAQTGASLPLPLALGTGTVLLLAGAGLRIAARRRI